MVKEALKNETDFGICMLNQRGDVDKNEHIFSIGTTAKVVDFDMLKDGLLGLTVEGVRLFRVESIETESDGLRVGEIIEINNWTRDSFDEIRIPQALPVKLLEIIESYPELSQLYGEPRVDDVSWVAYRWLELLPISASDKQKLITENEPTDLVNYLNELVK